MCLLEGRLTREDVFAPMTSRLWSWIACNRRTPCSRRSWFLEISWGSGLRLNVRKCVVVLLWPSWTAALRTGWWEQVAGMG